MRYDPERHHRRSIRVKGYDYAQAGAYFVTVCTQGRQCLFGDVAAGEMRLNEFGQIVLDCWLDLPRHYPHVALDAFVVMPNHVHAVVMLIDDVEGVVGAGFKPAPTANAAADAGMEKPGKQRHGLPEVVRAFKTFSARRVNALRASPGLPLWQRNYYEHIIRNDAALDRIRAYIAANPAVWEKDPENPAGFGKDVRT